MQDPLTTFVNLIANQIFAVVVAAFLLIRVEQRIQHLADEIHDLVSEIRLTRRP